MAIEFEKHLVLVDNDQDILESGRLLLKQIFRKVSIFDEPADMIPALKNELVDLVLLDMNFSSGKTDGSEGLHWLEQLRNIDPELPVVMITAFGDIDLAVKAIRQGAVDFVLKPWNREKMFATLKSAIDLGQTKRENRKLISQQKYFNHRTGIDALDFIAESPEMKKIKALTEKIAPTDADILILGSNGTGKEVIARRIHQWSKRSNSAFIHVDLGAISESLFESELFGYEKGAYTDAKQSKPGLIELADNGTLFLDEIGNLSIGLQAKLLRVLQNRSISRLGSNKEYPVNFRLVCATNMPIYEMVKNKEFREDLLYRINMVEIEIPELRYRKEDINALIHHYLQIYFKKYKKKNMELSPGLIENLSNYQWPGNVRELRHLTERAVILNDSGKLSINDFQVNRKGMMMGMDKDLLTLEENEKQHILKTIAKNRGNMTQSAKDLGIARAALYRRIKKYDL